LWGEATLRTYDRVLEEVRLDKSHGALWLSCRVVDAFIALVEELWGLSELTGELRALVERARSCRPSMASIANVAEASSRLVEEGLALKLSSESIVESLRRFKSAIEGVKAEVARRAVEDLSWPKVFMTHSLSSTVLEFFKLLGGGRTVVVTESRPLMEGVEAARALGLMGFDVKLVVDAAAYQAAKRFGVEVFVFGADSVLPDGYVVNKAGTAQIAIALKHLGVENACLCESVKVNDKLTPESVELEVKEPSEVLKEDLRGVEVFNLYFDLTPPSVVDKIVMEDGVHRAPYSLKPFAGWRLRSFLE